MKDFVISFYHKLYIFHSITDMIEAMHIYKLYTSIKKFECHLEIEGINFH